MRLVHNETQKPVVIGDWVKSSKGSVYKVVSFNPPHKPSSSGKIIVSPDEGHQSHEECFVQVFDLTWIEREDRGWMHPEVHMRKVFEIIEKNTGEDVSGYNLDTAIAGIRQILISDKRYTGDELRFIKDWLNEQELPAMLKPQSGL